MTAFIGGIIAMVILGPPVCVLIDRVRWSWERAADRRYYRRLDAYNRALAEATEAGR